MRTIKDLKDSGDYLDEHNNGYYWALKNVLELIDEMLEVTLESNGAFKTFICKEELKTRIEGENKNE